MKRGFYTIMAAQFCSSLADNALFVGAVQLLRASNAAEWQLAALVPMFALFYVLLAPYVGAFADSLPKGRVMLYSNSVKILGCLYMLMGSHPLVAYAIVGLGAAAYSPAKYGILTELLPASQLVKANGWIEGLTIGSIILGVVLGGQLVSPHVSGWMLQLDIPFIGDPIKTLPEAAILQIVIFYVLAAIFNTHIPDTEVPLRPMPHKWWWTLVPDFWHCNMRLWRDRLGQISLGTTTLFWGVSGNLRYIVLAWAAAALGMGVTHASSLVGVIAIGTAVGAIGASVYMRLDQATRLMPLGIVMGLLLIGMNFITSAKLAAPFLILLGGLGGFLVVPMNALLQHRGHNLMGAGRSIAVQNFNEQLCILSLGMLYSFSTGLIGLSAFGAIALFGVSVSGFMWLIGRWHKSNLRNHTEEIENLIEMARNDKLHG